MVTLVKPHARSLVVAPRLPEMPKGHPFQGQHDIVLDCDLCGWNYMGPADIGDIRRKAHYREFHASAQVGAAFLINRAK